MPNNHPNFLKAAWLKVEDKGILTIHDHVITRNYRISLVHSDSKNFILTIKNVQEVDRGLYMCQINTQPMISQVGQLDIVVPPDILVNETSSDVVVSEGSNVTLRCKARGYPQPKIFWKREDKEDIPLTSLSGKKVSGKCYDLKKNANDLSGKFNCSKSKSN